MAAIRSAWLRWTVRGLLGLLALVVLAVVVVGLMLKNGIDKEFKPQAYTPPRPLSSYADEAPPPVRPVAAAPAPLDWAAIDAPPASAKPWIRWWWPGGDVDNGELRREIGELTKAGFGGAEVQPFGMGTEAGIGKDQAVRDRVYSVDTPGFFKTLQTFMGDAEAAGFKIDMNHYSGWPAGSSAVTAAEGLQTLAWSEKVFTGGKRVTIELPRPKPGLNAMLLGLASALSPTEDIADFDPKSAEILSVVVARPKSGGHNFFSLKDGRVLEPGSVRVVDAQVKDGKLVWDAPEGKWVAVAAWIMPTGQPPLLTATKPRGYAVDVLRDRNLVAHYNYAFGQRSGLTAHYGKAFNGFFNDSLEFAIDRMGSKDILDEFKRRRGYDLRPHLPVIFRDFADNFYLTEFVGHSAPNFRIDDITDPRVRYDYQLTLSDLVIERFVKTSHDWAEARGLKSRAQSYGMDLDILRAEGANHTPETEQLYAGGGTGFMRMAASAAALYDRDLVSAESFVWQGQDYVSNPGKLKAATDRLFLSGVNHVIYHGFPYDWQRDRRDATFGPIGWAPFSPTGPFSENYSPRNPIWSDIPALNSYIGRSQNLLRQGKQSSDVLIYYPYMGFRTAGYGSIEAAEPLFYGTFPLTEGTKDSFKLKDKTDDERILWLRKIKPVLDELNRRGITWGWVNGDGLRNQLLPGGKMKSGATYGAILFPEVEAIAPEDLAAAQALAGQDTPVFLYGGLPSRQPGFLNAAAGDAKVKKIAAALGAGGPTTPTALADRIVTAATPGLRYDAASGLRRYSRALPGGASIDFFANETEVADTATLVTGGRGPAWWFDAATGRAAPAVRDAQGRIRLSLEGYGSRFLIQGVAMPQRLAGGSLLDATPTGRIWSLDRWTFQLGDERREGALFDWREDKALAHAKGPAVYRTTLTLPERADGVRYALKTGLIPGSARVKVNGRDAGSMALPPAELDVTDLLRPGANQIEIVYTPALRNWINGQAASGDPRFKGFKKRSKQMVPAGLIRPIAVAEYRTAGGGAR